MEQVLLVVQVLLAMALIGMVLIQRSDSDGFGLSGGSGNNLLSGRGAANLMTRTTAIIAGLFILNSLALDVLAAHGHAPSIVQQIEQQSGAPAVPVVGADKAAKSEKKVDSISVPAPVVKAPAPAVPAADADAKANASEKAATQAVKDAEKDAGEAAPALAPIVKKPVHKAAPAADVNATPIDTTDHNND